MKRGIVLFCIMMVGGLMSWGNTTNLDEHPKKQNFVKGYDFQVNDFQKIYAIAEDNEIVDINQQKENWCDRKKHLGPKKSAAEISFKKPPQPKGMTLLRGFMPTTKTLTCAMKLCTPQIFPLL